MVEDLLMRFGLSPKEALVYIRALALGSCPASLLAKRAGLRRPTVYAVLERLRDKGFMSTIKKGHILFFTPADPEVFLHRAEDELRLMRERAERVSEVLPELRRARLPFAHMSRVRFFEGEHGLRTIFHDVLSASSIRMFGDLPFLATRLARSFSTFLEVCLKRRIPLQCIIPVAEHRPIDLRILRVTRVKYLPLTQAAFDGHFLLYDDKVALVTFRDDVAFGVVIESPELTTLFTFLFDFLWEHAP